MGVHMSPKSIYITRNDLARLQQMVHQARSVEVRDTDYLANLEEGLERGKVVGTTEVPPDVVTMNSRVLLRDPKSGEQFTYTLVFPAEADLAQNKVSVLAPIGTAVLGCRVGEVFEWETPTGTRSLQVAALLYQPEAAGDYHL